MADVNTRMLSSCVRRSLSSRLFSRSSALWRPQIDPLLADIFAFSNGDKKTTAEPAQDTLSRLHLPPLDQWKKRFPPLPSVIHRVSVRNPQTARAIAEAFVPIDSRDKEIIEAYPGNIYCYHHTRSPQARFTRAWSTYPGIIGLATRTRPTDHRA